LLHLELSIFSIFWFCHCCSWWHVDRNPNSHGLVHIETQSWRYHYFICCMWKNRWHSTKYQLVKQVSWWQSTFWSANGFAAISAWEPSFLEWGGMLNSIKCQSKICQCWQHGYFVPWSDLLKVIYFVSSYTRAFIRRF
jgi:hypothetical protein